MLCGDVFFVAQSLIASYVREPLDEPVHVGCFKLRVNDESSGHHIKNLSYLLVIVLLSDQLVVFLQRTNYARLRCYVSHVFYVVQKPNAA